MLAPPPLLSLPPRQLPAQSRKSSKICYMGKCTEVGHFLAQTPPEVKVCKILANIYLWFAGHFAQLELRRNFDLISGFWRSSYCPQKFQRVTLFWIEEDHNLMYIYSQLDHPTCLGLALDEKRHSHLIFSLFVKFTTAKNTFYYVTMTSFI